MKKVPIYELKRHLSTFLSEVAGGATILITRHNKPIAYLQPADLQHVHVGTKFGKGKLRPLLKAATRGRYLEVLLEDRRGDFSRSSR